MNDKDLPAGDGDEFELDPDTGTDDTNDGLPDEPAIPLAEPAADSPRFEEAEAPPPGPAGPRVFPEHFWMLMGLAFVLAATLSVWARPSIHGGVGLSAAQSIKLTLLRGLALYGLAVGIANICTGRLKAMGSTFLTGLMALWFGIKQMMSTWEQEACRGWSGMEEYLKSPEGPGHNFKIHVAEYLGQWAPGAWMGTLGGAVIVLVFLKAMLFAKKQEAPPAPARRRRR